MNNNYKFYEQHQLRITVVITSYTLHSKLLLFGCQIQELKFMNTNEELV